jgi:hypothetical protein
MLKESDVTHTCTLLKQFTNTFEHLPAEKLHFIKEMCLLITPLSRNNYDI